jgi:hypothetical protein
MKPLPIPQLGLQVFVITDNNSAFLNGLHTALSMLPDASKKYYTLHHCCPPIYWEHAGGPSQEARQEAREMWEAEESTLQRTQRFFDEVSEQLQQSGIPADHIRRHLSVNVDDPLKAVLTELEHGGYTGVIVSSFHHDLVSRLHGRGLTDYFRHIPKVEVWALDESILGAAEPT